MKEIDSNKAEIFLMSATTPKISFSISLLVRALISVWLSVKTLRFSISIDKA